MIRKPAPPALLLALMIATLAAWQCGCRRPQPASNRADEETRVDPPAESSGDPLVGSGPDVVAQPGDDPFGADSPAAEEDPFGGDSGDPFAAAPADDDPWGAEPSGKDPFAERAHEPAEPAPLKPGVLFYPATRDAHSGTAKAAIKKALDAPISLELVEVPLDDFAALLRDRCRINVAIDWRAFDDAHLKTAKIAITFRTANLPLRESLEQMFGERYLAWTIRYEALVITTPEDAEEDFITRVYDVADLVTFRDEDGEFWQDHLMLEDAMTDTVAPSCWDCVGGEGSLRGVTLGGARILVVTQTEEIHRQVAKFLKHLRSAARKTPGDGPPLKKRRPQQRRRLPHRGGIPVVG